MSRYFVLFSLVFQHVKRLEKCHAFRRFFVMKTFPQKGATIRPVQGQAVYTIGNMDSGGARQGIRLPTQCFQTF